jgi:hypothetical protein
MDQVLSVPDVAVDISSVYNVAVDISSVYTFVRLIWKIDLWTWS